MLLSFFNPSRCYDANKCRVQFWGYDSALEISFFVEADALKQLCPDVENAESEYLFVFDTERSRIIEVAEKVYKSGERRRFTHILSANDFDDC